MSSKSKIQQGVDELATDPDIATENAGASSAAPAGCPYHRSEPGASSASSGPLAPYRFIPLRKEGNSFKGCHNTAMLLEEIGGRPTILKMTTAFYNHAFQDTLLDQFLRDHNDPHFERLGNWIVEKMDPTQNVWTMERRIRNANPCPVTLAGGHKHVVSDRSSAHAAAWYSPKRPADRVGEHFQLHDARVWMRLMFWSARETGVFAKSPSFECWYVRFIAHFIRVYEGEAPQFGRESARWSLKESNTAEYLASAPAGSTPKSARYSMPRDVCSIQPYNKARQQIPDSEKVEASSWPYNTHKI